jgi:hypothetical protein
MPKIISSAIAALLAVVPILSWATATTYSNNHAKLSAASSTPLNPFEFMKNSKDLPHQQYDAY